VIFVHGCFWHSHKNCRRAALPKTRTNFWRKKIASNVARDARNKVALRADGWRVFELWTCQISQKALARLYRRLANPIHAP
jgi:DNA mismatch endonuclease (patch repair protein)